MSWQDLDSPECAADIDCDPVEVVIRPKDKDLGGLTVRRVLPALEKRHVGPFIFFDQMGPTVLSGEQSINVRPHPHIGLSTLTWLFEGAIMHRDSLGYVQEIQPGEVNWMTAGSGIVHSERSPEHQAGQEKPLFGLQIWMALPLEHEETEPSFQHYAAEDLPVITMNGVRITVIAGTAWGQTSPVAVYTETLYADITMAAGAELILEASHEERALYPISGSIEVADTAFQLGEMIVLKPGHTPTLKARADLRFVMIGGAPLTERRHMFWNFVSSSKERIEEAKEDWQNGAFAKVPGDDDFTPLP